MGRRSAARSNAVTTAARLFQERGYGATGLTEIIDASHSPKGSFYFHFPEGKEQLAVEALRASGARIEAHLRALAGSAATPGELISRFAEDEIATLVESDYRRGCPIATVALERSSESAVIREACRAAFESWIDVLDHAFEGVLGADSRPFAERVVACLEGGLLLARVERDPGPLRRVAAALVDALTEAGRRAKPSASGVAEARPVTRKASTGGPRR